MGEVIGQDKEENNINFDIFFLYKLCWRISEEIQKSLTFNSIVHIENDERKK